MTPTTVSLVEGLREVIASGRLTEAMIPDDFHWLEAALEEAERDLAELEDRRRSTSYFGAETGELREAIATIIRSNSSPTYERGGFHARNGGQAGYIVYEHDGLPGVLSGILDLFGLVDHPIATIPLNEPVLVFDAGTGDVAIIELRRPGEFHPFGNPRNPRPATHWRRLPPKGKRP
ncbi:hypothetical protein [Methylosinus sp. LW4]|uniref:hypothetical protein n=1 Tax=Methylosinus sp. LW4 TaxID=136993 RepID=UPI0012FBDF5A|nr:hypothetical protein [Methylosinus sp. LW4]